MPPPKNIALVVHDALPGIGHGRYCLELAKRLQDEFQVHVWANRWENAGCERVQFHHVPAIRFSAWTSVLTFLMSSERMLRKESARLGPQSMLIHAQGLSCWSADVITAHICNAARHQRDPASRPNPFWAVIRQLEKKFYQQRRARHLIAISGTVLREISCFYQWNKSHGVIYHGTDTDRFRPPANSEERSQCRSEFGLPARAWTWLFIGQADKGLRDCMAALLHFPQAVLLVITRSPAAVFQKEAQSLGIFPRIIFFGPTEAPERAYRAADVFVYPSPYDAFGLVLAEAMASQMPVVASDQIGAAEWITSGTEGLLFSPADSGQLRTLLWELERDAGLASRLGAAARQKVAAYSWDRCARETAAVYRELFRHN